MPSLPKRKNWKHIPKPRYNKGSSWGTKASKKFYNSRAWRRLRKVVLSNEPFCRMCGYPAVHIDHIESINRNDVYDTQNGLYGEPLDIDNLQPLCLRCHNKKTSMENKNKKY